MPGRKISQTPLSTRLRIGWRRPSQPLKSPTTRDAAGMRRPDREAGAGDAFVGDGMGAQAVVQAGMGALARSRWSSSGPSAGAEAVGVVEVPVLAAAGRAQPVAGAGGAPGSEGLEEAGRAAVAGGRAARRAGVSSGQRLGAGDEGAERPSRRMRPCGPSTREGVAVAGRRRWRRRSASACQASALMASPRCGRHLTGTFQISSAYSRMVRSEENQPMLRGVQDRRPLPGGAVWPSGHRPARWAGVVGVEVGGDHEVVAAVQGLHQVAVAAAVVGREDAGADRLEHLGQPRRGRDRMGALQPLVRGAPPTSSVVRPKMKMLSAPTCSSISTLAPSSVPMVSAPFSASFMLPVPEASMPAVEICSDRSAAGMIDLGEARRCSSAGTPPSAGCARWGRC